MINILDLPCELIQNNLIDKLGWIDQINFICICNKTVKYDLTNLYCSSYFSKFLTDNVLEKYSKIYFLNLYDNLHVTDLVNHTHLRKLNISGKCRIKQNQINHLSNLTELDISNNIYINNVSNDIFPKLKTLIMNGVCDVHIEKGTSQ
jgi:hypothetical protein